MSTPVASSGAAAVLRYSEVAVGVSVVSVIALLVVPLPPVVLDFLLALSIGLSLVVLLVALSTRDPLEFSVFPALLLLLTLFRLSLNVSSTRLILGRGEAGRVIEAFGQWVIGGNYAVGLVLFLILVGINFVVITKGAGRVAEVAARFTLDAMPGRQLAIDVDLNSGLIDEATARRRREEIARQADFYGAMDGASKFVKGDAIAGLLITAINIGGGIFVGVVQRGLPFGRAVSEYTILTVGDGLVSQIPALVVSTAAGIVVTHAASGMRMGAALATQLGGHPRAMWISSGVLATFAVLPGLPALPFLALAGGTALLARAATAQERARLRLAEVEAAEAAPQPEESPMRDLLQIDPIELEVGYALIELVDEREGGDLLERISMLRKQAALELGMLIPSIRIRDDIRLPANEYVIKLRGAEIARAQVLPRHLLALDTGGVLRTVEGIETEDPSFGMAALWIPGDRRAEAEAAGYVVVEPSTVVATHLMETLKSNAAELLGRQDVQEMTNTLRATHPALVDDVIPAKISLGVLHRVLQRLLKERIPVRDLVSILEALGDAAEHTRDAEALTEHVRRALANQIARLHMDESGDVRAISLGPRLESALMALFSPRPGSPLLAPESLAALLQELSHLAAAHASEGRPLPLVAPPALRTGVRRLLEPVLPHLPVLSLAELPPQVNLHSVATWELSHA